MPHDGLYSLKLSPELITRVSIILSDGGVVSVLWGTWLLRIHGVPTVISVGPRITRDVSLQLKSSSS